jgi:hypothetical protein
MALGFTALLMLTLTLVGAVSYYHQNSGVLVFFLHDPALTAGSLQIKRDGQVITHVDLARDHEIRLQAGSLQLEAANPDVPLAIYDGTQQGAGEGGTCAFQLRPGETRTINVHPIRTKKP